MGRTLRLELVGFPKWCLFRRPRTQVHVEGTIVEIEEPPARARHVRENHAVAESPPNVPEPGRSRIESEEGAPGREEESLALPVTGLRVCQDLVILVDEMHLPIAVGIPSRSAQLEAFTTHMHSARD